MEFSVFLGVFKSLMQLYFSKTNRLSTYDVTSRRGRATIVAVEKQYVIYSGCVLVFLDTQNAMRIHSIEICGLQGSTKTFHNIS